MREKMENIEALIEPIYNNYMEAIIQYFSNKLDGVTELKSSINNQLAILCIILMLSIKLFGKLKEFYLYVKGYYQNESIQSNQQQNEYEREANRNNISNVGINNRVTDSLVATSSNNSVEPNSILNVGIDNEVTKSLNENNSNSNRATHLANVGINNVITNSLTSTNSYNSDGKNDKQVKSKEDDNPHSKDVCSADNVIIKGNNNTFGGSAKQFIDKKSSSADNVVIIGDNIKMKGYANGPGINSSSASNFKVVGSDIKIGDVNFSNKNSNKVASLRQVVISIEMVEKFREKAKSNSDEQAETSGILFGKPSNNKLILTHLYLLSNNEMPDSGIASIEDKVVAMELDVTTLGWISTHSPMDSNNFHSYFDNHQAIKEAIAVVVPKVDERVGICKISDVKFLVNSRLSKIPVKNEKALLDKHPSHVKYDDIEVELIDVE